MKHFLVLIALAIAGYVVWNVADRRERNDFCRAATKHGFRLGAIVLVIALLLAGAVYFPASPIF